MAGSRQAASVAPFVNPVTNATFGSPSHGHDKTIASWRKCLGNGVAFKERVGD